MTVTTTNVLFYTAGQGRINVLRQRIHSGIMNATEGNPADSSSESENVDFKHFRHGRGTVLHIQQTSTRIEPSSEQTGSIPPQVHHRIQLVQTRAPAPGNGNGSEQRPKQTPPSLKQLAQKYCIGRSACPPCYNHPHAVQHTCPKHPKTIIVSKTPCPNHSPGSTTVQPHCPKHNSRNCPHHHKNNDQPQQGEHTVFSGQQTFQFQVNKSATTVQDGSATIVQEKSSTTVNENIVMSVHGKLATTMNDKPVPMVTVQVVEDGYPRKKPAKQEPNVDTGLKVKEQKSSASEQETKVSSQQSSPSQNVNVASTAKINPEQSTVNLEPSVCDPIVQHSNASVPHPDKDEVKSNQPRNLRSCAQCGKEEPAPKKFKKCQK